jgi:superfamily II DNA/RNA helicase
MIRRLTDVTESDPRLAAYRGRITSITGSDGARQDALYGFAPQSTEAPPARAADLYDIVVTTDVLAEGVNLQQARHIITYDLPWNPMRVVQRHDRIDRIGSRHTEVFLRCFFPDQRLDDLLGLEERLERKLKQAAAAVGVSEVLPGGESREITFTETRDEIARLRHEDATLFENGGTGYFGGAAGVLLQPRGLGGEAGSPAQDDRPGAPTAVAARACSQAQA